MAKTILVSPILSTPNGIMSHGVEVSAGKMVFVSGQVSRDAQGEIVGKGDIRAQTRQVLENMKSVLAQGGATMDDVVKVSAPGLAEIRLEFSTALSRTVHIPK